MEIEDEGKPGPSVCRTSSDKFSYFTYKKLVVPVSMRSIYWKFFGFPASESGELITKTKIICVLCKSQIAYNKNTSNLRMHLQNKHLKELVKIEKQNETSSKPKKIVVKPKQIGVIEHKEEGEYYEADHDQDLEETQTLEILKPNHVILQSTEKQSEVYHVDSEDVISSVEAIANLIITDLTPPDVVDGKGLQRLMVTLRSPCEIPSKMKLTNEIIPNLYKTHQEGLEAELSQVTTSMALTVEEWSNLSGLNYLTVGVYYYNQNNSLNYKVLSTLPINPSCEATSWILIIETLLREWNINVANITAAVVAVSSEDIVSALLNKGITLIPCLDHTIKECVRLVLDDEEIIPILNKVRAIVTLLQRDPQAAETVALNESAAQVESTLTMDNQSLWLSTLNMIDQLLLRQDVIENIFITVQSPLRLGNYLSNEEWQVLQDVSDVLQPFKVTLVTLNEERFPVVSLVKPLLWQVVSNRLQERDSDTTAAQTFKRAIAEHLTAKYSDEAVARLLQIASTLDPRFKMLPYCSEVDKANTAESIKESMRSFVDDETSKADEPATVKARLSGMEMLLGDYRCKKVKVDPSEVAEVQYSQFYADTSAPLDSCPVAWWAKRRGKYTEMAQLADSYMCVPACATLPGHLSQEAQCNFFVKRASFLAEPVILDQVLFLHINQVLQSDQGADGGK